MSDEIEIQEETPETEPEPRVDGNPEQDSREGLPEELRNLPPEELRYLQLVTTLQKIANDVQGWLARAEQALHNHNLRINVLETFLCHPDFKEMREKFVAGNLELSDLQKIATDYIQPELQKQAEQMNRMRKEAYEKMQAEQRAKASVIVSPHTGQPAGGPPELLTPDGRKILLADD